MPLCPQTLSINDMKGDRPCSTAQVASYTPVLLQASLETWANSGTRKKLKWAESSNFFLPVSTFSLSLLSAAGSLSGCMVLKLLCAECWKNYRIQCELSEKYDVSITLCLTGLQMVITDTSDEKGMKCVGLIMQSQKSLPLSRMHIIVKAWVTPTIITATTIGHPQVTKWCPTCYRQTSI